ncbi:MAG TPA: secretin N-terminal domain-containing protein [Verrucomicrobiae bacterium]|nr:secretin N-terminal domain-containing protein [Verrucomicrobiae bacterium]
MKAKKIVTATSVGLMLAHFVFAQNSNSLFQPVPESQTNDVTTNQPAETAASNQVAETTTTVTTNAASSATVDTTVTNAASTVASNEVTTVAVTNEPSATAETNAPAASVATIPLIQFQDVPITTAIENLARQAGINYLLDPRIGYGQPDEKGQIKPEPTLSIRWENVTAEQALQALLNNYGLQLVENLKTKVGRITIKDPTAPVPLVTRVVQLKYASVSNMTVAVQNSFTDKRSKVVADNRTSQLVIVATDSEQTAIDQLIDQLDKPTRQVLIETRLMEVSSSPSTAKGIDWSGTLAAQNISIGNNALPGTPPTPANTVIGANGPVTTPADPGTIGGILSSPSLLGSLNKGQFLSPETMFLNADGVKAVLSFLNQDSDAQVIATPRIVTLDNETAHIEVSRAVPIFNNTAGTQGSPGGSTVQYTNLGTILDVTPRISANDYIWLTVAPEVSSVFDTVTKTVAGTVNQADEYDIRRVNTQVLIPNSNTLVMGGFIKDNTKNIYTKVPLMGDIPVLGYAFRHESKSLDKDNLLIFITPTIVKDTDFQPASTQFLKSSPLGPATPMDAQKAWNSAKPRDWSNPKNTDPYLNSINESANQ